MKTRQVSAWVDCALVELLHNLRRQRPHVPTLRSMATRAVQEGLNKLRRKRPLRLQVGASQENRRQSLALRLPVPVYRQVVKVTRKVPEAASLSAALHLLLWLGANQLLQEQQAGSTEAA